MGKATERQRELAAFLKARRAGLVRADFGLPPLRGGKTLGLRREEVAVLTGVSVTWYTWLEQARDASPSRQVVDALARELRFTPAERAYVLELAGYAGSVEDDEPEAPAALPEHLDRLLKGWRAAPAFALTADWDIVGWNDAYAALYPAVGSAHPGTLNLLRVLFEDESVRRMMPNWAEDICHFVAEYRAEQAVRVSRPSSRGLVERLSATSEEFAALWARHDIERFTSRMRIFEHPRVGLLHLEVHRLRPSDEPGLSIVVYTAVPGVTDLQAFERLGGA